MTVPAAAASIGVPSGTPMSMPGWKLPQRGPNGLVTGPLTGQIRPAADGVGGEELVEPLGDDAAASRACAARIASPSAAEAACSWLISSAIARSCAESFERLAACESFALA